VIFLGSFLDVDQLIELAGTRPSRQEPLASTNLIHVDARTPLSHLEGERSVTRRTRTRSIKMTSRSQFR
jgi:hypothetical protein